MKGLEDPIVGRGREATPESRTATHSASPPCPGDLDPQRANPLRDRAHRLDRVHHEIEDDLPQLDAVGRDWRQTPALGAVATDLAEVDGSASARPVARTGQP